MWMKIFIKNWMSRVRFYERFPESQWKVKIRCYALLQDFDGIKTLIAFAVKIQFVTVGVVVKGTMCHTSKFRRKWKEISQSHRNKLIRKSVNSIRSWWIYFIRILRITIALQELIWREGCRKNNCCAKYDSKLLFEPCTMYILLRCSYSTSHN